MTYDDFSVNIAQIKYIFVNKNKLFQLKKLFNIKKTFKMSHCKNTKITSSKDGNLMLYK